MSKLPLQGVRIADFSWLIAGPRCTQWLGVMGAEVIKIETNQRLDMYRNIAFADNKPGPNRAGYFHVLNYNKKSCTLNLSQPKAVEIAKQIIKISDVVIENFAAGVMDRFGLSYDILKELKPDLIMVSSSALGKTGPDRHHVAYGATLHSFSGLCSITGYSGGPPRSIGGTYTDPLTATNIAFAILAALHYRSRTGQGQYIDVSMCETTMVQLPEAILEYTMNARVPGPMGNQDGTSAPHDCYPCKGDDKWVAIAVSNDEEWEAFCNVIGRPYWCMDDQFSDQLSRYNHRHELDRLVSEWTRNYTPYQVMSKLQEAGVPAGPSCDIVDLLNDPHLKERELFMELDYPEVGRRSVIRMPWKLSPKPDDEYKRAPLLSEDNDYVFHQLLGMPYDEIKRLSREKIIY